MFGDATSLDGALSFLNLVGFRDLGIIVGLFMSSDTKGIGTLVGVF